MLVFLLVQSLYWLALATWFGGALFLAISAPVILQTLRDANPMLPNVLRANLEKQHGSLLHSQILGNLLIVLARIEIVCSTVIFFTIIGQWALFGPMSRAQFIGAIVRSTLYIAAVVILIYHHRFVRPRIFINLQEYIDHADEPEIANPAKERFDQLHKESITLLSVTLALLMGIIFFSGMITASLR